MDGRHNTRIGVLTFHKCINYGSYWQAKSLIEWLRSHGLTAELLNYNSPRANAAELKCAYRPSLPIPAPRSDRPFYRKKIEKFFRAFAELPTSLEFPLEDPSSAGKYDVVIVGSDEVWNLSHPWYGGCDIFYGENLKADRILSYAASFGNYHASAGLSQYWSERLVRNFDAISVRDENSRILIEQALNIVPAKVVDPCLLHPPAPDLSRRLIDDDYLAVYGHNFSQDFAVSIRNWAIVRGLKTVSIGYRNDWADIQLLSAGPADFNNFMSNAECVATNFFHGCVFALNNNRPFVCEAVGYRNNKISDLVSTFEMPERLLSKVDDSLLDKWLTSPPDGAELIARLRSDSRRYLLHNLYLHAVA
jgi:hypothetical protein